MTERHLEGRIALVTGASRGIGYFTARNLALAGAEVVAVARSGEGLQALAAEVGDAGRIVPYLLDLGDYAAIAALGREVGDRYGRLDILIANAADRGPTGPLADLDPEEFDRTLAINFTSIWHMIRAFDGLLRKSDAGRVAVVSSGSAHFAQALWGPYPASKAALETMARSWSNETLETQLCINIFDPGPVRTAIRGDANTPSTVNMAEPEDVAQELAAAVDPRMERRGEIYQYRKRKWSRHIAPD